MSETPTCPHCATQMTVEYDLYYDGAPRFYAECSHCGMRGPICACMDAATSAVTGLDRAAVAENHRLREIVEIARGLTLERDEYRQCYVGASGDHKDAALLAAAFAALDEVECTANETN